MSDSDPSKSNLESPLHYLKGRQPSCLVTDSKMQLTVTEINHGCYLNLRGNSNDEEFLLGVRKVLNITLPTMSGAYVGNTSSMAFWLSPDEWILVSDQSAEILEESLRNAIEGHISIVDISGGLTQIKLEGPSVDLVLKKASGYDFESWSANIESSNRCVQTNFAKATALVSNNPDGSFNLTIRRSFADYIGEWLLHVGSENGCILQ